MERQQKEKPAKQSGQFSERLVKKVCELLGERKYYPSWALSEERLSLTRVCAITSIEEAKREYFSLAEGDARKGSLGRWIELCTTVAEAKEAYLAIPTEDEGYKNERRMAKEKWVALCATVEEARDVCICTKDYRRRRDCPMSAIEKWEALALERAISAKTLEESRSVYEISPEGSEAGKVSWKKWNKFVLDELGRANTIKEIRVVFSRSTNGAHENIFEKWLSLCETIKDIREFFGVLLLEKRHDLKADMIENVFEKWIGLCSTPDEAEEVYKETKKLFWTGERRWPDTALVKWENLFFPVASSAKTFEEAKDIVRKSPPEGRSQIVAYLRMFELCSSFEQAHEACYCPQSEDMTEVALARLVNFCMTVEQGKKAFSAAEWYKSGSSWRAIVFKVAQLMRDKK